ncbi:MAG: TPM domain-containing protein, partial [Proteobacteria bacterium]|nr:TPM domain-containing protein [Pseudomonadota bacterium]
MNRRILLAAVFLAVFLTVPALALEPPDLPRGRVTDLAGVLAPGQAALLDQRLADFEKRTSIQIAVLVIPSLEGDPLEDYFIRLADKWKAGQKGEDNGVILLVAVKERKIRIEVGYGLEGRIPDGKAGAIIRDDIAPSFRQGDYFSGIGHGIGAIMRAAEGLPPSTESPGSRPGEIDASGWGSLALLLIFLGVFAVNGLRYKPGGRGGIRGTGRRYGGFGGGFGGFGG